MTYNLLLEVELVLRALEPVLEGAAVAAEG